MKRSRHREELRKHLDADAEKAVRQKLETFAEALRRLGYDKDKIAAQVRRYETKLRSNGMT